MDFLLIVLGVGGVVFAVVMLVLASRVTRLQHESNARVERLQAMATGSVLFAEPLIEPAGQVELSDGASQPLPAVVFDVKVDRYPFVITVPAGAGRVTGSFDRSSSRSRT